MPQKHLAFDLKMFAFHKQWIIEAGDVVKLLKTPNEDVVQARDLLAYQGAMAYVLGVRRDR